MKTIGELIIAARVKKDLTRPELAKKLGLSETYLAHLERSDPVCLSVPLVNKLKKILGPQVNVLTDIAPQHNHLTTCIRRMWKSRARA